MADHDRIRRSLRARQMAPVPLRVAASLVYFQLRHGAIAQSDEALERALDDAALALAQITDIYYENPAGSILRIPDDELRGGRFEQGAKTFRSAAGQEFRFLSMRRIDLMYAMEVLATAGRTLAAARREGQPEPSDLPKKERE